jgi:hypothetical protein
VDTRTGRAQTAKSSGQDGEHRCEGERQVPSNSTRGHFPSGAKPSNIRRNLPQLYKPRWRIDPAIAAATRRSCLPPIGSSDRAILRGTEWYIIKSNLIAEVFVPTTATQRAATAN